MYFAIIDGYFIYKFLKFLKNSVCSGVLHWYSAVFIAEVSLTLEEDTTTFYFFHIFLNLSNVFIFPGSLFLKSYLEPSLPS